MFLKSDKLKKTESKCDLLSEEKRESIASLDLVIHSNRNRKWHTLPVILVVSVLALIAWIMIYKQYRLTTLSSHKIEEEIHTLTMKVVRDTEQVIRDVHLQAGNMCNENRQAAIKYIMNIRDAMKERTQIGVEKMNQIVQDSISQIRVELLALETTTKDIYNGLVDIAQNEINKIMDSVSTTSEDNLAQALEAAILAAEQEVRAMWDDLDQMYTYYTSYTNDLIAKRMENMTDAMIGLLNKRRKFCDCTLYDRVNMCYNISLANIETSKTIKMVVETMNNLYNTTNTIDNLQSIYLDVDEHASTVIEESKSLLATYKKSSQLAIERLLSDHFCFLGTAIRDSAENTYPHIKRYILRTWRIPIDGSIKAFNSTISDEPLIKDEYRSRIIGDVQDSLHKLSVLIQTKAEQLPNQISKNWFMEKSDFNDLNILMRDRFKNITEVINPSFASGLSTTAEILKYDVEFIVDQKLPFLSSLSIRNYLPTDVCPVSMDFANYVTKFLNDVVYKESNSDILDYLLPTNNYISLYESNEQQIDDQNQLDQETSPTDSNIQLKVVIFNDEQLSANGAASKTVSKEESHQSSTALQIIPIKEAYPAQTTNIPNETETPISISTSDKLNEPTEIRTNPGDSYNAPVINEIERVLPGAPSSTNLESTAKIVDKKDIKDTESEQLDVNSKNNEFGEVKVSENEGFNSPISSEMKAMKPSISNSLDFEPVTQSSETNKEKINSNDSMTHLRINEQEKLKVDASENNNKQLISTIERVEPGVPYIMNLQPDMEEPNSTKIKKNISHQSINLEKNKTNMQDNKSKNIEEKVSNTYDSNSNEENQKEMTKIQMVNSNEGIKENSSSIKEKTNSTMNELNEKNGNLGKFGEEFEAKNDKKPIETKILSVT